MNYAPVMRLWIFLLIVLTLFLGCSHRLKIESLPLPDPHELITKADSNLQALHNFSGMGTVEIFGPDLRKTVAGLMLEYLKPDYLSLILKGPLGISVGSLILAGDQYKMKINDHRKCSSGKVSEFRYTLGKNFEIEGEELRDFFLPLIAIKTDPDSLSIDIDKEVHQYKIGWSEGADIYHLWADPYTPLFTQELVTSAQGDTLWFKRLSWVQRRTDVFLPSAWTVRLGGGREAYQVKVNLAQLQVNVSLTPDNFKIEVDSTDDQDN